jgi:hypothetical protein
MWSGLVARNRNWGGFNAKAQRREDARQSRQRLGLRWQTKCDTALAGAHRAFGRLAPVESAVAATLCRRNPKYRVFAYDSRITHGVMECASPLALSHRTAADGAEFQTGLVE